MRIVGSFAAGFAADSFAARFVADNFAARFAVSTIARKVGLVFVVVVRKVGLALGHLLAH